MIEVSGIESCKYVPEEVHYTRIEPVLNNRSLAHAYNDKNFFERYLTKHANLFPEAVLRVQYGSFYDADYQQMSLDAAIGLLQRIPYEHLVLKPSVETGGGSNVAILEKSGSGFMLHGKVVTVREVLSYLERFNSGNSILQVRMEQHDWFCRFNQTSLNTLRLYVYRSITNDEVNPLNGYIRFGRAGSIVDSSSQGGFTMGVGLSGITNSFYIGRLGDKHTWEGEKLSLHRALVPNYADMVRLAKQISPYFPHHRLLGFDFAVDSSGKTRLLEVNNLYVGIINQQMSCGPLFGEYLEEVIEYCMNHKKSYSYHFYRR